MARSVNRASGKSTKKKTTTKRKDATNKQGSRAPKHEAPADKVDKQYLVDSADRRRRIYRSRHSQRPIRCHEENQRAP